MIQPRLDLVEELIVNLKLYYFDMRHVKESLTLKKVKERPHDVYKIYELLLNFEIENLTFIYYNIKTYKA